MRFHLALGLLSTGTEPDEGTTGGEGATSGDTEGATGGADDGGGSKGCSVASERTPGWALVLLGLWGLGRRRRRPQGSGGTNL